MNTGIPQPDWDQQQQRLGAHMLQGSQWALFQTAVGRTVVYANGDGWSWQGMVTHGRGVNYLYVPYGPTARSAVTLDQAMESLKAAGSELELDFVRCEPVGIPEAAVVKLGLVKVKESDPQHTLIVDLTKSEDELRAAMSSSQRNTVNGGERRGLSFRMSSDLTDLEAFLKLIHETFKDRGIRPHPDSYYRTMLETLLPLGEAKLGIAEVEGKPASVSIVFDHDGTRGYAHTGNSPELRKLRATAPLVWFMMLDAKAAGMKAFDLWGIAPVEAPKDHPWQGFTEFKRAFGGEEVTYTGTWELPLKPLKYKAIRLAKRLRG